ncbi:hypothetical protein [Candidatus Methanoprimaticola sp. MG2]|uniref:hypothetical protein n=1 Tax=Candidatus Methanoprimaticola sp. MG2 TaxID=3228838 RepID=UPI0039C6D895
MEQNPEPRTGKDVPETHETDGGQDGEKRKKIPRHVEKKRALEMRYAPDILTYILSHPLCIRQDLRRDVVVNGYSLRDTLDALWTEHLVDLKSWREKKGEAQYHCILTEKGVRVAGLLMLVEDLNRTGGSFEDRLMVDRLLTDIYGETYGESLELARNPPSGIDYVGPDEDGKPEKK